MTRSFRFVPLALALSACGSSADPELSPPGVDAPGAVTENGIARLSSALARRQPDVQPAELSQLARDNGTFAVDLYHELRAGAASDNFFYSPHSISTALAMAYVGARTQTKEAIRSTLHFDLPDDTLHQSFNALDRALDARQRPATEDHAGVVLRVTNDLWASSLEHERPRQEYVDALALDYRSKVSLVDFSDEPAARRTINGEVSRQTEGTLDELLGPGLITNDTTMILTNTIYFKASWAQPFVEGNTRSTPFVDLDGNSRDVDMMDAVEVFDYAETDAVQAIRLPYVGGETALLVLLPKNDFTAFESGFDIGQLDALRSELAPARVHLGLPTFSMRSEMKLKETLQSLGMHAGFEDSPSYDFSGIGPQIEFITEVVHEAFIAVDEAGTEAGAATAVIFGRRSAGPEADVELIADRPFMVVLEDVPTGAVLFAGRHVKPE